LTQVAAQFECTLDKKSVMHMDQVAI
jgi:hypothetical protein